MACRGTRREQLVGEARRHASENLIQDASRGRNLDRSGRPSWRLDGRADRRRPASAVQCASMCASRRPDPVTFLDSPRRLKPCRLAGTRHVTQQALGSPLAWRAHGRRPGRRLCSPCRYTSRAGTGDIVRREHKLGDLHREIRRPSAALSAIGCGRRQLRRCARERCRGQRGCAMRVRLLRGCEALMTDD